MIPQRIIIAIVADMPAAEREYLLRDDDDHQRRACYYDRLSMRIERAIRLEILKQQKN